MSLALDVGTVLPVVLIAVFSGSMLLYSDIFDYAKSFLSGLIAWKILRAIRRGDTREYDYGPGKMESLGGLIGSLIFLAGLTIMIGFAVRRLLHPVELHAGFTLLGIFSQIVGLTMDVCLWRHNKKLARREHAPLMEMQWRANRADAMSCLAILSALSLTLIFRSRTWDVYIDPACALLFLLYSAASFFSPLHAYINDLADKTHGEELQLKILRRLAENYEGYEAFHGVRSRRVGTHKFIEIALGFHPEKRMGEALDTIERLREGVMRDIPNSEVSIVIKPPDPLHVTRDEKTSVKILPLSPTTLGPALELIRSSFNLRPDEKPEWELEESLYPGKHTSELAQLGMSDPRYWVVFHHNTVIGVAGLTFNPADRHEAIWGGWAVYKNDRRTGLSRARYLMLKRLAIEAHASGKKYFRLYTTTVPSERQANHLYDRIGLTVYRVEENPDGRYATLYRQAETQHLYDLLIKDKPNMEAVQIGAG